MAEIKKHRKQWLISYHAEIQEVDLPSFFTIEITDNIFLHYDSDLKISYHDWPDGKKTIIIGLILGAPESPDTIYYNCGRFVAITENVLSLDATGSMGVFYFTSISDALSGIICGSSCALISEISHVPLVGRDLGVSRVEGNHRMNWDPSPLARLPNMKRMFIDQKFNIKTGAVLTSSRSVAKLLDAERAAQLFSKELVATAFMLKKVNRPVYLALTGGLDSRTVFSALICAEVEFKAVTLLLDDERSLIDAKIAEALCNEFGIYHESISPEFSIKDELEIFLEHTGGCGGDRADKYVIGNYYRELPEDALVLHGGAFEIGQRSYETSFKRFDFFDQNRTIADLEKNFSENFNEKEVSAIKEWLSYRKKNPIVGVDMIDSFFIDQRRAAWGAANRQAEDCYSFDWLVFANSWRLISLLLAVSVEDRRKKVIQKRAMDILLPGIVKKEHINPRVSYFKIIKNIGIRRSIKRIFKIISRKLSIIQEKEKL